MYIYKITNTINQKIYIGKTVQKPQRRWYLHKYNARNGTVNALYNAIRKYGVDAFVFEVVVDNVENLSELNALEIYCIKLFNSCCMNGEGHGYNMTEGGDGGDSLLSKQIQDKKVAEGNHHFQGEKGRQLQLDRIAAGTHNFTPENRKDYQSRVVRDKEKLSKIGTEFNNKRVEDGTHPWLGGKHIKEAIANGTHISCITFTCPHCGKVGKGSAMKQWHFDNCKNKEN